MSSFSLSNTSFSSLCDKAISHLFSLNSRLSIFPENTPENRARIKSIIDPLFDIHMKSSRTQYDLQVKRLFPGFAIKGSLVESVDPVTSETIIIGIESILTSRLDRFINLIFGNIHGEIYDYFNISLTSDYTTSAHVHIDEFCEYLNLIVESYLEYYENLSNMISLYRDECEYHNCITKCQNYKNFECNCVRCTCKICVKGYDRDVFNICNIDTNCIFAGLYQEAVTFSEFDEIYRVCCGF
jgi:hypothetical protein